MSENNNTEKVFSVEELFNGTVVKGIYKDIMDTRVCIGDDLFTYTPIERAVEGKTYTIAARHVPIGETMSFAKSSCNKCYGTGKKIIYIDKSKIGNTNDFLMLASVPVKGQTEEQQKIILEMEKKEKAWRVLLPCPCTIKNMYKKKMRIVSNEYNNIIVEISCTEKITE